MRILVTGGSGFIGSNFILYWLDKYKKDLVVNLDKLTYAGNPENLKKVEDNPNYRFIKGDICDRKTVEDAVSWADIIVHFAAESHVDRSISGPDIFLKTNIIGTQNLLSASVKKGNITLFHHISTDEVYGSLDLGSSKRFSEETKYDPGSPYAASKASSDLLVRSYARTYGLRTVITNCSNNYGPFQHPEKFIPLAITNIIEKREIPLYGDGKNVRDWLYVGDHCEALDLVIKSGIIGETFCIGGLTSDISNKDVLEKIFGIMKTGEHLVKNVPDRPGHDRRYAIDWGKINRKLGWKPRHDFDTWLEKTVGWYESNVWWWSRLKKKSSFANYYKKQYKS